MTRQTIKKNNILCIVLLPWLRCYHWVNNSFSRKNHICVLSLGWTVFVTINNTVIDLFQLNDYFGFVILKQNKLFSFYN